MRFGFSTFFGNPGDWDRFLALEAGEEVGPPEVLDSKIWREELELAVLGDELGFDTFWTQEQHAAPYLMSPDAHMLMAYLAGRTKRIDFGSSITVLPWHNPFRLAEQITMLQHMLGPDRRYILGVGRGSAARNFDAMNVKMDESRDRFNEVLDVLQLAFTKEIFSYEGKFFTYNNASLRPRPLNPDAVITEAFGTWTSNASLVNMAERGLHPLTTPNTTPESYLEEQRQFNEVRVANGHGPALGPAIKMPLICAQSEQEALERAEEYLAVHVQSVVNMYQVGTDKFGTAKGYESYRQKGSDFGDGTAESATTTLTKKFMAEGVIGTPEQCIEKVIHHYEQVKPSEFVVMAIMGNMPASEAEKSMRLFAEQALPKLRVHIGRAATD